MCHTVIFFNIFVKPRLIICSKMSKVLYYYFPKHETFRQCAKAQQLQQTRGMPRGPWLVQFEDLDCHRCKIEECCWHFQQDGLLRRLHLLLLLRVVE